MSSDDGFDQFVRSAGGLGAPEPEDLKRVKASLSSRVSWRRALPIAMSNALRTSRAAAGPARVGFRSRFLKVATVAVSAVTLSAGIYAVTSSHTATIRNTSPSESAPPEITPAPRDEQPAQSNGEAVLTIDDPAKLPDAISAPIPVPAKDARRSGSLDAEVALLTEANTELHSDPTRSLALIERHAREFPRGVLGPEFEAQRALALAALGRHEEACALASRFLAAHPSSPLAPKVRASCDSSR
ncbi:MAG: hypothetical protein K0S65_324 [Labilithrix sp.]|nr:hypothetical protein [Labilithrix sp.]